jgi:hypothetical protein
VLTDKLVVSFPASAKWSDSKCTFHSHLSTSTDVCVISSARKLQPGVGLSSTYLHKDESAIRRTITVLTAPLIASHSGYSFGVLNIRTITLAPPDTAIQWYFGAKGNLLACPPCGPFADSTSTKLLNSHSLGHEIRLFFGFGCDTTQV